MFEYKFIRLKTNAWTGKTERDYREIVKEYSEAGWRLVQIFQKLHNNTSRYIELILERPKDNYV